MQYLIQYLRSWDVTRIITVFHIIVIYISNLYFYTKGAIIQHIVTLGSLRINSLSHAAKSHEVGLHSSS